MEAVATPAVATLARYFGREILTGNLPVLSGVGALVLWTGMR